MSVFMDHYYSSFYDPFAEGNVVESSDVFPNEKALSLVHIDAPPPYSTLKSIINVVTAKDTAPSGSEANDLPLTYNASTNLDIQGQGTVVANCTQPICLLFSFSTNDPSQSSLYAQITENSVDFWYGPTPPKGSTGYLPPDRVEIQGKIINTTPTFLRPDNPYSARYWFSVDHKNGILRFGRDYTNLALTLYEARLKEKVDPGVWHWIDDKVCFTRDTPPERPG